MKIAVLGAGNIGRVHLRILNKLGIEQSFFLSRTEESGIKTSEYLLSNYGVRSKHYSSFESLMSNDLDGVTICLPNELHYDYLVKLLDHGLPIFCEKPLFWNDHDSCNDI